MSTTTLTERAGMGANPHEGGVAFRVWATHADCVFVMGAFNQWTQSHPMQRGDNGTWHADVPEAKIGDEYRYLLCCGKQKFSRIDPFAREVTNSVGNGIVHDPQFDSEDKPYPAPPSARLVLYEMHIGTFNGPLGGHPAPMQRRSRSSIICSDWAST